jgi:hypothetical protein
VEADGSIEHEFCYADAVVYDMTLPAAINFHNGWVQLVSKWLLLILAVLAALELHRVFTVVWRDRGEISRQSYVRGVVSVAAGLVIWVVAGSLFGVSLYHVFTNLGTGTLGSRGIPGGFLLCSVSGYGLMRAFTHVSPGWRDIRRWPRWPKNYDPVLGEIRTAAGGLAVSAIFCMVFSTVYEGGYLAGGIFVLLGGIFALILGFWPIRDSATHLPSTL